MSVRIHDTAIVGRGAELGVEVTVGPYSVIGPNVTVGDRSKIGPHVVIDGHTTLGSDNELYQFSSVGSAPQDLKFRGEPSKLVIGSKNVVREFVTLQPGTASGSMMTSIGDGNLFMANCHVAHDCRVGNYNVFANSAALAGHVTVQNRVIVGGLAGIHQFCRVGDFAILSAGTMVGRDVPPYTIGQGDRATLRGVNILALKRAGMSATDIAEIKRAYRYLFGSVGRLNEKIAGLPPELAERPLVKALLEFIAGSKRGILNPSRSGGVEREDDERGA